MQTVIRNVLTILTIVLFSTPLFAGEIKDQDYVTDVLPYPLEVVHERTALLFDSDTRDYYEGYPALIYDLPHSATNIDNLSVKAYKQFKEFPLVRSNKFYVFYAAYSNMQHLLMELTPYAVLNHNNAALERYASLSQEARAQDFYLWSPDAPFWYSDDFIDNRKRPFHSYFIVHMTKVDETHTYVEIIENEPVIQAGKKLSVDSHGIVHHFDIQESSPTTSDRKFLLSCIRQFIERNVPARHYFNCKTPVELALPPPVPFTIP